MIKRLLHSVDIDADQERVWQVLIDLSAYPQWNPFIIRAVGNVEVGSTLVLRMQPVGGRAATLRPTVVDVTPGTHLRWKGRLALPDVLDADHQFVIETLQGGGSRLTQDETFSGLLVPIMASSLERHTLPAFAAMNAALKARAEKAMTPRP
jgi:hypothetical protein